MTFVTFKKFGNKEYAYELTSYWDKKAKQPRHKTKYLGVVIDKEKGIYRKTLKEKTLKEELILDFGDTFLLHEFLEKEGFIKILKDSFGKNANMLFNLISYRLCHPSAMRLAEIWQNGNAIKYLCKANLSSQRISDLMVGIGLEENLRLFFKNYLSFIHHSSDGLLLDITAMPNQIHMPFSQWGYHDEDIDKQINLMLVVDKASSMPLFFRYIPGSIPDVSSLKPTIEEMKRFGIRDTYSIFDAGFYSENNIKAVQEIEMPFMIRLPANRRLYKKLVNGIKDLEDVKYAVRYGKRALFIKKQGVDLFGKPAFAYIVLDPARKGRETTKLILQLDEMNKSTDEKAFLLKKKGIMILLSSIDLPEENTISFYYSRQIAEQLFKFSKDDLNLLPLRTHKEESMRGYLLLVFITLSVFLLLQKNLEKKVTVEEALLLLRNLKVKVFEDEMLIPEITKEQRLLFERFDIIVPKVLGI
jgi:transposase